MILTVYLSDGEQAVTEVPITPETTCRDVVEFCKEPGESGCHLAEVWRGNERAIPFEHMMYEHLQKWGPRKQEVKFFLRHEDSPAESSDPGSQQSQDQTAGRSGGSGEKHNENGATARAQGFSPRVGAQPPAWMLPCIKKVLAVVLAALPECVSLPSHPERAVSGPEERGVCWSVGIFHSPRVELTLSELQEMASRQQQQIEAQQQMLVAKGEKLQRLKDRVESQEAKLKKIRAMRGQVDYSKVINGNLRGPVTGTAALELRKLYQELQRNLEVSLMDKRISELRQRLHKKRAEARQKEIVPLNKANGPPSPQPALGTLGRVAAVGPYIQVPVPGQQQGGYTMPPDPLKPQTLGINTQAPHGRSKSGVDGGVRKPPGQWKVSDLDIVVDPVTSSAPVTQPAPLGSDGTPPVDTGWPAKGPATLKPPDRRDSGSDIQGKSPTSGSPGAPLPDKVLDSKVSSPASSKPLPPPYGSHHSTTSPPSAPTLERRKDVPAPLPPPRPLPNPSLPAPACPTYQQPASPLFPPGPGERGPEPLQATAVRPLLPGDRGSRPQSPRKGPATMNSSSIYHMYLQQAAPKGQPPKPALKAAGALLHPGDDGLDASLDELDGFQLSEGTSAPPPSVDLIPRPLSPTKLTPMVHSPMRYQSDTDLEVLRKKLANAPRPLKKRSSITEPEGPSGPNIQKLLYQRFNTLAGGMEGGAGVGGGGGSPGNGTPFYQPAALGPDNGNPPSDTDLPPPPPPLGGEDAGSESLATPADANDNRGMLPEAPGTVSMLEESTTSSQMLEKRTNLKKPNSERTGHGLRVENPSTANDEGITPLHNAVCAGHHHIVKFLLDFGRRLFLYGVQEKLGVMNKGTVYGLWRYEAQGSDELTFTEGDPITVLRRHDDSETDWWWAGLDDAEGYVPRNLLGWPLRLGRGRIDDVTLTPDLPVGRIASWLTAAAGQSCSFWGGRCSVPFLDNFWIELTKTMRHNVT
ncbi:hypothetical protein NHX12_026053, partial [Muraenolepis orangiensis]